MLDLLIDFILKNSVLQPCHVRTHCRVTSAILVQGFCPCMIALESFLTLAALQDSQAADKIYQVQLLRKDAECTQPIVCKGENISFFYAFQVTEVLLCRDLNAKLLLGSLQDGLWGYLHLNNSHLLCINPNVLRTTRDVQGKPEGRALVTGKCIQIL